MYWAIVVGYKSQMTKSSLKVTTGQWMLLYQFVQSQLYVLQTVVLVIYGKVKLSRKAAILFQVLEKKNDVSLFITDTCM